MKGWLLISGWRHNFLNKSQSYNKVPLQREMYGEMFWQNYTEGSGYAPLPGPQSRDGGQGRTLHTFLSEFFRN